MLLQLLGSDDLEPGEGMVPMHDGPQLVLLNGPLNQVGLRSEQLDQSEVENAACDQLGN